MNQCSAYPIWFALLVASNPVIAQHADCNTALEICEIVPIHIDACCGTGQADADVNTSCVGSESNSWWVKWTVLEAGLITFIIIPDSMDQDIDFVVYRSGSDYDCNDKTPIRCMAAGANTGQPPHTWVNCTGATGLAIGETDLSEPPGCLTTSTNYLAPIEAAAGDHYIMLINEFSGGPHGYTLNFTGSAVLDCGSVSTFPAGTKSATGFAIYPTVSTGTVSIHIDEVGLADHQLNVFTMEGQLVYSKGQLTGSDVQIDLHHLSPGAYFAVMQTNNANHTQRFVLTR